jgi:hypothetical protein
MSQPYPPSTAFTSLSGYITPIPCQYCREQAHLVNSVGTARMPNCALSSARLVASRPN